MDHSIVRSFGFSSARHNLRILETPFKLLPIAGANAVLSRLPRLGSAGPPGMPSGEVAKAEPMGFGAAYFAARNSNVGLGKRAASIHRAFQVVVLDVVSCED